MTGERWGRFECCIAGPFCAWARFVLDILERLFRAQLSALSRSARIVGVCGERAGIEGSRAVGYQLSAISFQAEFAGAVGIATDGDRFTHQPAGPTGGWDVTLASPVGPCRVRERRSNLCQSVQSVEVFFSSDFTDLHRFDLRRGLSALSYQLSGRMGGREPRVRGVP